MEAWKKKKVKELSEGEFRQQVVELLGLLVEEVKRVRLGLSLHNMLQQRSLCAREGLVPRGDLLTETFVYDGQVRVWGTETEWVMGETDEESEAEDDEGEEEEEEEEEDEGDIVIEEPEQEEPEQDAEE